MKTLKHQQGIGAAAACLALCAGAIAAAPPVLFGSQSDVKGGLTKVEAARFAMAVTARGASLKSATVITLNRSAFNSDELTVTLPNGKEVTFSHRRDLSTERSAIYRWSGPNMSDLAVAESKVDEGFDAQMRVDGTVYNLFYLSPNKYFFGELAPQPPEADDTPDPEHTAKIDAQKARRRK
jgi:hypothetical protein